MTTTQHGRAVATNDQVDADVHPALPRGVRLGRNGSVALRPRAVIVCVTLALATFVVTCLGIRIGDLPLSFAEVVAAIFGSGSDTNVFIVRDLRMPRALVGVIVGIALGISGAIVQSVARNPLASPDILGITAGAGVAAVFLVTSTGALATSITAAIGLPGAALIGGLATGTLVYLLAMRGGLIGMRLILIGIAISAVMHALTTWMLVGADIRDATRAQTWLVGSLESRTWDQVFIGATVTAILAAVAISAAAALRVVQLGDDTAVSLGTPLVRVRAVLLICAALLAGISVAVAGPIAFVAFVAPQVAMRLTGLPAPPMIPAALTGALLLTGSDLIARTALPVQVPVGIITAAVGGPFLVYLLVRANLKASQR